MQPMKENKSKFNYVQRNEDYLLVQNQHIQQCANSLNV